MGGTRFLSDHSSQNEKQVSVVRKKYNYKKKYKHRGVNTGVSWVAFQRLRKADRKLCAAIRRVHSSSQCLLPRPLSVRLRVIEGSLRALKCSHGLPRFPYVC